ncbi:hypothetical protein EON63_07030 [archaeon]|nr:MAG: hypothetical protein EON63_07030 [archaeon]
MTSIEELTTGTAAVRSSTSFLQALIAGAVAGFATDVSLYPLDTLKTRLQVQ